MTNLMVSLTVFGESDFAKTFVANSSALPSLLIFGASGFVVFAILLMYLKNKIMPAWLISSFKLPVCSIKCIIKTAG